MEIKKLLQCKDLEYVMERVKATCSITNIHQSIYKKKWKNCAATTKLL